MIGRADLIKRVAERSAISPENSSYFFEVFINRISSRLKPGEATKFFNDGFFQKRNCRFPAEKSKEKSGGGTIVAPLILFSEHAEITADPKHFYAFRIPDLKTLWENDSDLLASLAAGDFAPAMNRSQLINTYATKAEVIISGLVKHHAVFDEELVVPFSLNLSLKETDESNLLFDTDTNISEVKKGENIPEKETRKPEGTKSTEDQEKTTEDTTLPWSFGKKFYDKKVDHFTPGGLKHKEQEDSGKENATSLKTLHKDDLTGKKIDAEEALDAAIEESDIDDSRLAKLREFEPVRSKLSEDERSKLAADEQNQLRSVQKKLASSTPSPVKTSQKFTEVKSKTETYHLKNDVKKLKKKKKLPELHSVDSSDERSYRPYRGNRTLLPTVMIISLIIVVAGAIYVYFIKGSTSGSQPDKIIMNVNPPPDVNVIDRDYEYAVTYPYEKVEQENPVEGINLDVFAPEKKEEVKQTKKEENLIVGKPEEVKKEELKKEEVKKEEPKKEETKPEVKPKTEPIVEEKGSRIFLYNNYYIVYVGSYSSYAVADREAEKYFNEGYNAFVEVEEIPGKPARYKLNVGDFTSEQFAREFESKYLK